MAAPKPKENVDVRKFELLTFGICRLTYWPPYYNASIVIKNMSTKGSKSMGSLMPSQ